MVSVEDDIRTYVVGVCGEEQESVRQVHYYRITAVLVDGYRWHCLTLSR